MPNGLINYNGAITVSVNGKELIPDVLAKLLGELSIPVDQVKKVVVDNNLHQ